MLVIYPYGYMTNIIVPYVPKRLSPNEDTKKQ